MVYGKRHINIPIFIPHLGCPNKCVFCNQHAISGASSFNKESIIAEIDTALSTVNTDICDCEIAFFGGSFTGIDRECMIYCLETAESYVKKGMVSGIRMSTRPDYIDDEILDILERYTVSEVELGIQSFSERVLAVCKRGHSIEDTVKTCGLLKKRGIPFVGQMMVGLPMSLLSDEVYCAEQICALGASGSRIYPTVVFRDTELMTMTELGLYSPLTVEDAVKRSAAVLKVFVDRGVRCLRVGLCESENLHSSSYYAGPNHPAMGELVGNELYYNLMCIELDKLLPEMLNGRNICFEIAKGDVSMAVGQKQSNKLRIENKYNVKSVKFIENANLMRYNIKTYLKNQ